MDDKILVAVIAALSALLGSLIPQIFSYFKENKQREFDQKKYQLEIQANVYEELLLALQDTLNNGNPAFQKFQEAVLKVSLHGDEITAKMSLEYFHNLVQNGKNLTSNEHAKYQTDILNAMKAQLLLPKVDRFELIKFTGGDL